MRLNCPDCNYNFNIRDLRRFHLYGSQIQCESCKRYYRLDWKISHLGIVLVALIAMFLFGLLMSTYFAVADNFEFSPLIDGIVAILVILFNICIIIYGYPAFLVWMIKKKYTTK